jgi:predicted naringenin-chalcone synthase
MVSGAAPVSGARLVGLAHAVPVAMDQETIWQEFFGPRWTDAVGAGRAERIWRAVRITTRHTVADPRIEDVTGWGTAARMRRFATEAPALGKEAVTAACAEAGLDTADIGLFAVASCTGYVTPGLDIVLARDLAMSPGVQRLGIGHMGCYAALPGLGSVADYVTARGKPAVLLCAELTTLHAQQPTTEGVREASEQLLAHALFADAAASAVVLPLEPDDDSVSGLQILDVAAITDPATAPLMTWDVTDLGFRMGLSPRVPAVLAQYVRGLVDGLLAAHGATVDDVRGWAVHPGGPRIIEVVAEQCGLTDADVAVSHQVLAENGNCSSATVLMVTQRIVESGILRDGDLVVQLAFGPGLTLYATLLRQVGDTRPLPTAVALSGNDSEGAAAAG